MKRKRMIKIHMMAPLSFHDSGTRGGECGDPPCRLCIQECLRKRCAIASPVGCVKMSNG